VPIKAGRATNNSEQCLSSRRTRGFFFRKREIAEAGIEGGGWHSHTAPSKKSPWTKHRSKAKVDCGKPQDGTGGCAHFGHSSSALGCICVGINLGFNSGLMYFNSSGLKSNKGGRGFPFGSRTLGSRNSSKSW